MADIGHPYIQPYQPPGQRGQLPGDMEPKTAVERYCDNMKRSPLPVTLGGIAGATCGALLAGPWGGALGVAAGLYLERKYKNEQ
eukprot:CAMPEP_0181475026 /NCGR_PEP_ID=MMETSP1110-20121109/40967_1 /TAXON_ID=174948 /ORGANISM="Symbiodinium sp., Strain CCMP421" /LENGTH=83 /DNA_ID=CAMNT_0023600241 /DNA_START=53 /DNA_END=304 /DNA_ORIENTATION=+